MGADIYLLSVSEPCKAQWDPKFHAAVAMRDALPRGSVQAETAQHYVGEAYAAMYSGGYYRDSYNSFGLFPQLVHASGEHAGDSLSWWRDVKTDKKGFLSITRAKAVRAMVASAKLVLRPEVIDSAARELDSYPIMNEAETAALADKLAKRRFTAAQKAKIEETYAMYEKERADLLALLDLSIAKREPLRCSL